MSRRIFSRGLLYCGAKIAARHKVPERYALGNGTFHNFTYFSVKVPTHDTIDDFLVTQAVSWRGAEGLVWEKRADNSEVQRGTEFYLFFKNTDDFSVSIQRIYGAQSIAYSSIFAYLLGEMTFRPTRTHYRELRDQARFNKRFKFSAERMSILRALIDWRKRETMSNKSRDLSKPFSYIDFFTQLNTIRAWGLPNRNAILDELRFVLDSLVDSGELRMVEQGKYALSGRALTTVSNHELDNRRSDAAENNNRKILWLTIVIAIATALQAFAAIYSNYAE